MHERQKPRYRQALKIGRIRVGVAAKRAAALDQTKTLGLACPNDRRRQEQPFKFYDPVGKEATTPGHSADRNSILKMAISTRRSSPVSPSRTGRFGKTQSGRGFGKAARPEAPETQSDPGCPVGLSIPGTHRSSKSPSVDHGRDRPSQSLLCKLTASIRWAC